MNGLEQRARQTAVEQLNARLDDLGLIVEQMAVDNVHHRDGFNHDVKALAVRLSTRIDTTAVELDTVDRALELRLRALELFHIRVIDMTFWERLCWLVRGFPNVS